VLGDRDELLPAACASCRRLSLSQGPVASPSPSERLVKFSFQPLTPGASPPGLWVLSFLAAAFPCASLPSAGTDVPGPEYAQNVVEVLVPPSPPADTPLAAPFPPGQQGPNFQLDIVSHFAAGSTRLATPPGIHPSRPDPLALGHSSLCAGVPLPVG
jgi:hypothetical protein